MKWLPLLGALMLVCVGIVITTSTYLRTRKFNILYSQLSHGNKIDAIALEYGRYGKKAGDYLVKRILEERDESVRENAISIVGLTGANNIEGLLSLLMRGSFRTSALVLGALELMRYPDMPKVLRNIVLTEEDDRIRRYGVFALASKYGNAENMQFIKGLQNDPRFQGVKDKTVIADALKESR